MMHYKLKSLSLCCSGACSNSLSKPAEHNLPPRHLTQHKITKHAIYARRDAQAQTSLLQRASSQPASTGIWEPHSAWNFVILNTSHIRYTGFQNTHHYRMISGCTEKAAELNQQFHDRERALVCPLKFAGGCLLQESGTILPLRTH